MLLQHYQSLHGMIYDHWTTEKTSDRRKVDAKLHTIYYYTSADKSCRSPIYAQEPGAQPRRQGCYLQTASFTDNLAEVGSSLLQGCVILQIGAAPSIRLRRTRSQA